MDYIKDFEIYRNISLQIYYFNTNFFLKILIIFEWQEPNALFYL